VIPAAGAVPPAETAADEEGLVEKVVQTAQDVAGDVVETVREKGVVETLKEGVEKAKDVVSSDDDEEKGSA